MRVPVFGMTVKSGGADLPVDGLYVDLPDPPPTGLQAERGLWTPIIGGTVSETGQGYSSQTGHYVKIGPLVTAWSYTQFSAKGQIVGDLLLKGLPFRTLNAPGFFAGACSYSSNMSPDFAQCTSILPYAGGAQTICRLFGFRPGLNPRPLTQADINDLTQLIITLTYPAD
jgi:hypothetical protein